MTIYNLATNPGTNARVYADDAGAVRMQNADGTTQELITAAWQDVTSYGATGNGTTDDTVAIQAALDAVPQKGGRVFLPAGTYRVTSSLLVNVADRPIEIFGVGNGEQIHGTPAGGGTVIVWDGAVGAPLISVSASATTVTIRDLSLDNVATGAGVATHGILAVDSDELRVINVLAFPASAALGFSTAAIELGASGHDLSKAHIQDCYIRNCVVGVLITSTIHTEVHHATLVSNTTCAQVGTATTTAYSTSFIGCTFEARTGHTGVNIVRGQSTTFVGCQFDAWDATHYGLTVLATAALADVVTLTGCRFTGNTVPYAVKLDFASLTASFIGCFFSGCSTAGILNSNNAFLNIIGCHEDDASKPIVSSTTTGSVRMIGNNSAGSGIATDIIGGSAGARVPSYLEFGGTLPTTGLIRFPKPSEQATLMTFRRDASAVDIPLIRTDASSAITIGEVDVGVMPSIVLAANTDMYFRVPTFYLRETGGTIRHTITNAAATLWDIAASTSLDFRYNTVSRFKMDSFGLGFNGVGPIARPVLATGAGKLVDDVITVLQNLGLVSQT